MANRNIAVGIDFSEYSNAALEQAKWVARRIDAEIELVYVGPPPVPGTGSLLPSVRVWEQLIEQHAAAEGLRTKLLAKKVSDDGIVTRHHMVDGDPAMGLAKFADTEKSEMIVVGTHGLSGIKFLLLGSVAQGVVRRAQCNVWVARGSEPWDLGPKKILMATDFSDCAEEALRVAIRLAPDDSTIDIVHCWHVPVPMGPPGVHSSSALSLAGLSEEMSNFADDRGERLLSRHATGRVLLKYKAVPGQAASGVIAHATRDGADYDLIVAGSHGRKGVRRFFLGSVAENIVRHAPCSTLIVHGTGQPDE
jgi:nucleotide-binding universal stress UspA family protein